jgi:16S rRNA (cytosine967-C5)-methyltransferase
LKSFWALKSKDKKKTSKIFSLFSMKTLRTRPNPHNHTASRLKHAVRLWRSYLETDRLPQLDRWIAAEMKKHRQFGKQDRYCYSEVLFAAVRFGYLMIFLDVVNKTLMERRNAELPPIFGEVIESFSKREFQQDEIVSAWKQIPAEQFFYLVGRRYCCDNVEAIWPVAGQLDAKVKQLPDRFFDAFDQYRIQADDFRVQLLWQGIPLSFAKSLVDRKAYSHWATEDLNKFFQDQSVRPPLWIRLNDLDRKAEVLAEFEQQEMVVSDHGNAIWVRGETNIFELQAYKTGIIEIQDLASQQIGACVEANPGECVWDCCAGEGGKTMQIASRMKNCGVIYASDIREYKLKELRQRVTRPHFDNVRVCIWDGETLPRFPREITRRGGFDWVVVDAPCTSTGTWRRNPDAKFRVTSTSLAEMTALQAKLLQNASKLVRLGGKLVYSTCSWLVEENEAIVASFLNKELNFRLVNQNLYGSPYANADSMFSAVMERVVAKL